MNYSVDLRVETIKTESILLPLINISHLIFYSHVKDISGDILLEKSEKGEELHIFSLQIFEY